MQLNTRRHSLGIRRHFNLSALLVPVRATEDDVRKVLRFFLASHTERPNVERTVRANFMPNSSKGGVESTAKAVLSSVGTLLQMPVTLGTKAGLQATEIRTVLGNC
eukprot:2380587-Amphidinium_carterae.1